MVDDRGENARLEDLPVNPCKPKHLTNMPGQQRQRDSARRFAAEESRARALACINIDGYVEAAPKSLRFCRRMSRCDRAEAHHRSGRLVRLTKPRFSRRFFGVILSLMSMGAVRGFSPIFNKKRLRDPQQSPQSSGLCPHTAPRGLSSLGANENKRLQLCCDCKT